MNSRNDQIRSSIDSLYSGILRLEEKIEMKFTSHIPKLNVQHPGNKLISAKTKFFGTLALGTILMAAMAGPISADTPSIGRDGAAASRSVPASAEHLAFTLWEFPDRIESVTKISPAVRSIPTSDDYLTFALGGLVRLSAPCRLLMTTSPAVRSISTSEDYLFFALGLELLNTGN